ncbi:hypothetical protein KP509_27G069800 [Ceratopteris richardii]|nr:hypothetical protein KP509_27G069800 [Ceratopteris richardii]KAH7295891.1 hypothetical protein KP509_27G069800 [Ceratopteris richardii]KAH7295892.1 hypothetical protein KP509_27G069800 [Ceratopteris richardii]
MVAWESPIVSQSNVQEENRESSAKEEEDDASLFYTDLMPMLVDVQDTVGVDAFIRVSPFTTIVSDVVNAHVQFDFLTVSTSGRMPFPMYRKYLSAIEKNIKELRKRQEYARVHNLPTSGEELVLEMDGISQTVIKHVGAKSASGRLTLTDHALYFEESTMMSYREAIKLNLSSDLAHEVFPELCGPWGSRIFDKAIAYKNSSLEDPIMFEFLDLVGSTRREYWLALIQEVKDCHMFIRKYRLDESCQAEAISRAILGIIRLQAIRDSIQILPSKPGGLLTFSSAEDFLRWGDLVSEALARTIKDASIHRTEEEEESFSEKMSGYIKVPSSSVKMLHSLALWREYKHSEVIYRVRPGELTSLEKIVKEAAASSKQTQKVKALEEEAKLDGVGINIAVMNELLRPVLAFAIWIRDVMSWNRPLETFHVAMFLLYVIYRDWLCYLIPFFIAATGVYILWLKLTNKAAKYKEIVVQMPAGGVSFDQVVTAQRVLSQFQSVLQAANVILLKIWALALSVKPEVTNLLPFLFFLIAIVMALIPFKLYAFVIHGAIFISTLRTRVPESKLQRRLRELWYSIPPLPVRIVESREEKTTREALQG